MRDYVAVAQKYMDDVLSGEVVACELFKLAVQRQLRDLEQGPDWDYKWDEEAANHVCHFFECLPHVEAFQGLIELQPVQCFILTTLFGWRQVDGRRRYNTAYVEVARKFGKSVLASGIGLYCLCQEGEQGAQVVCAATTGDKAAKIVLKVARMMVLKSTYLRNECGLEVFANAVVHEASNSSMYFINSKSSTQDGLNPHCLVIDELHAHADRGLFDVLRSARGARSNPMSLYITTAGTNMLGVAFEQHLLVEKMLKQSVSAEHYFGVIFTIDEGDDPFDPEVWIKANPMLGITPGLQELTQYAGESKLSPSSSNEYKTKRLNLWLHAAGAWLNMELWDRCADRSLKVEDFKGQRCWIGVDLSQNDDLTAVALVFEKDGILFGFVRYYLPSSVVEERTKAVPAYKQWVDQGILTMTDGGIVDLDRVEEDLTKMFGEFRVLKVNFDQFGSAQIGSRLINKKMPAELIPKNAKNMTPPARELEARVKCQKFRHNGDDCLRWQASNVVVTRKIDGTIIPKKDHPMSANKIDGVDALLQAIAGWLSSPIQKKRALAIVV